MSNVRKQITDNPLLDQIIYECQSMIYEGIVFKNEDEANECETLSSIQLADKYADVIEGKSTFATFTYGMDLLDQIPYLTSSDKILMAQNNTLIPEAARETLYNLAKEKFLADYEEQNNYYRKLNGLPNIGDQGIKLPTELKSLVQADDFDFDQYVHEMSTEDINVLKVFGVVDALKEMYPGYEYLNYLGDKKIDPYVARALPNFSVLYLPSSDSTEVHNKFLECLDKNRVFFLKTVYSEAYKRSSEYYDNFIIIMILIQSFADMITLSPEYIIRRELFDLRTIQYVFESNGCEFYSEIPLKYQKRLVRNLNRLIKYKSCDKNLVDIASLFGFDDIKLFKYYILRIPIMNSDGTYRHDTIEDPDTGEDVPNYENNYQLKFLRVPIDEIADENIKDKANFKDYDTLTRQDKYWDGPHTHAEIKKAILEKEFNICLSKYISIDSIMSLTELTFQLVYFINMVLYAGNTKSTKVELQIPEISSSTYFPLTDTLICLYSLMYLYNGFEDDIMYDPVQVMAVSGFNFEADMSTLASYVKEKGFTLEELGVANFQIPKNGILTWNQLLEVYLNNKAIYNHVIDQINYADNKKMYDIYRTIYNSLMITKLNFDYFKNIDGTIPTGYGDYLEKKGSELFNIIQECRNISKVSDRQLKITNYINHIVENIFIYLDQDTFQYIFHNIPTVSIDFVRMYMCKVLNFFKSYKVDILNTNTIYNFDIRIDNKLNIIDEILFKYLFQKDDQYSLDDIINDINSRLEPQDRIYIEDKLYMDISIWAEKLFKSKMKMDYKDNFINILISIMYPESIGMEDEIYAYNHTYEKKIIIPVDDHVVENTSYLTFRDFISLDDVMYK